MIDLIKRKLKRCVTKVSGTGRGSKRSTLIWKIVWKQFWSRNRCLQIPLQKICLCKLKINLWYPFLAETTKPVEYFLVESCSSSGKLEKETRNKKRVEFHVYRRKVDLICLLLACTNIRITSSWKSFRNSSSVILLHLWLLLYLKGKLKINFVPQFDEESFLKNLQPLNFSGMLKSNKE